MTRKSPYYNHYFCFYCKGNHNCRNCPLEKAEKDINKQKIGHLIEDYIEKTLACPECDNKSLKRLANNSPSLDIICMNINCNHIFEVKSKCLSCSNIPDDIFLNHGSYYGYMNMLRDEVNLIIIIYAVDRINKFLTIKEILYAPNSVLICNNIVNVVKNINDKNSKIYIKKRTDLIKIDTKQHILNFGSLVDIKHQNLQMN